jgi:hypothetical protein
MNQKRDEFLLEATMTGRCSEVGSTMLSICRGECWVLRDELERSRARLPASRKRHIKMTQRELRPPEARNSKHLLRLFVLVVVGMQLSVAAANPQVSVVDVGSRAQLFVDQELVYESRGVSFTLHQARKVSPEPLVRADQPCEGPFLNAFGTVIYDADEELFKMWYDGAQSEYFDGIFTYYATSRDGIAWDKSHTGTIESLNGKPHNAVAKCMCPSVMKDPHDPDPARRYKMVCYVLDRGYCSMMSPDGRHWKFTSDGQILPISYVDDVITACWSDPHQRFVAFAKQTTPVMGRARRTIWTSTSHDFDHWSAVRPALVADRRDDLGSRIRAEKVRPLLDFPDNHYVMRTEVYGTGAYSAESCLIAFPWMFTATMNVPKFGNQEGPIEVQLATTRDLVHWSRPFRTPIIEMGKPGEFDSGMIITFAAAFDRGDEVWLYYHGSDRTHGAPGLPDYDPKQNNSGIGLATWKKDRFVSADGSASGAELTTVPIQFSARRLELNANVKEGGSITVELLDMSLNRLAEWPKSTPLTGDSLRHVVTFGEHDDVSELADQPIVLRFHLRDAELYSYAFRE